jgi:hypothetical protein
LVLLVLEVAPPAVRQSLLWREFTLAEAIPKDVLKSQHAANAQLCTIVWTSTVEGFWIPGKE